MAILRLPVAGTSMQVQAGLWMENDLEVTAAAVGVDILNHCIMTPKTGRVLSWES